YPLPDRRHGHHGRSLGLEERLRTAAGRAAGIRTRARRTRLRRQGMKQPPAPALAAVPHAIGTILIIAVSGFLAGFDGSLFTGAVYFVKGEFALDEFQTGWAVSAQVVTATISIFLAGPIADRIGRRTTLRIAA